MSNLKHSQVLRADLMQKIKNKNIDWVKASYEAEAILCRRSLFRFVRTFWSVIIQEEPIYNWHIKYLCDELQKIAENVAARKPKLYDLIINIPPGTTKSTIVTVMFPAWLWAIDASLRIITNSYSGSLSIEHSIKSKDIIESDNYKKLFPEVALRRDKSGKQHYENDKGGFRYATSTGATITGYHAHIIIVDDPINPKQASSDVMRETAKEHMKTLSSRKVNKANTPIITVMQRLHVEDPTGYQLERKADNIRHICLPAEVGENVKPAELKERYVDGLLDPIRLNREVLAEAKVDMGSLQYAGQYGQSPIVEGGNIIKDEWFKRISASEFKAIHYNEPMHFYLDTAFGEKKAGRDNDPSGIIAACRIKNDVYIYNAKKVYKEMPELLKFLPEWMSDNKASKESKLMVEPKANGESVVQMMERYTTLNVKRLKAPTESKMVRITAQSPRIECGRVFLVEGSWNEEFLTEVCGFPNQPHDEFVDVLAYAIDDLLKKEKSRDYTNLTKGYFGL